MTNIVEINLTDIETNENRVHCSVYVKREGEMVNLQFGLKKCKKSVITN